MDQVRQDHTDPLLQSLLLPSPPRLNWDSFAFVQENHHSTVYTVLGTTGATTQQRLAIKRVKRAEYPPPHSILDEILIQAGCHHPNILSLLAAHTVHQTYYLLSPFYPISLAHLIHSNHFIPPVTTTLYPPSSLTTAFSVVAHSLAWQIIDAIHYLHQRQITHRDVSLNNFLLDHQRGLVKLIDFGVAVDHVQTVAPVDKNSMDHEVGTDHYRAPELLFGSRCYDPRAIDLWSLGVTLSEFFTPLITAPCLSSSSRGRSLVSLVSVSRNGTLDREDEDMKEIESSLLGMDVVSEKSAPVRRQTLFKSAYGEFALIGSIFRVIGTPTIETWPEAVHIPSFHRFTFLSFPPTPLVSHLPHLPTLSPLEAILESFLSCSAAQRMSTTEALARDEWMDVTVLSPMCESENGREYETEEERGRVEWNGKRLGELVRAFLEEGDS